MKHRWIILLLAGTLLLGGGWLWFRATPVGQIVAKFNAPIEFYGKVVDQNGDPVADANVGYSALDKFMAPGTGYTGKSDANGFFSIGVIKVTRIGVNVRKA